MTQVEAYRMTEIISLLWDSRDYLKVHRGMSGILELTRIELLHRTEYLLEINRNDTQPNK